MDILITILQIIALLGIGFLAMFKKNYFPKYLEVKAKNIATKEDIEEITDKVESVKTDYAKVIEEIKSNNQLKLSEIEREKNIRKEVYLQAVESLTRYLNTIANLPNININEQDITRRITDDSGVIAKVQIVGSESTVKSVTEIMGNIGATILELILERGSLVQRKNHIDILDNLRSKSQSEIERYISIMKNMNLEGNHTNNPLVWKPLNDNIEFETKQRDQFQAEIDDLWVTQNSEQLSFTKKCMDKYFEISLLIPNAVISVREDLGLPISNEAYLEIFNKNIKHGKHVLEEFYEKVSKEKA